MKQGSNRRLANVKTRSETGFDYVRNGLELMTPFAQKLLKELRPFFPGEEDDLRQELDRVERMTQYAASHERLVGKMQEVFMCMKDLSYSIQRCGANTLSVVELFEIKTQLLEMTNIRKLCLEDEKAIPEELIPYDVTAALDILDPRKDRLNTFYIYNDFSDTLAELRKKKHDYEVQIRRAQKARKEEIRKCPPSKPRQVRSSSWKNVPKARLPEEKPPSEGHSGSSAEAAPCWCFVPDISQRSC